MELTDGHTASPYVADGAWQGRFSQTSYSFTVDLGVEKTFQSFESGFYKYSGAGIGLPYQVEYRYSSNQADYMPACSVGLQEIGSAIERVLYQCSSAEPITARYVQMTVSGTPDMWSFVDEWRVLETFPISPNVMKLGGSFIQPQLVEQWYHANWQNEFQLMKSVGMNHLILQWSADTKSNTAVYPSSVPGLTQNTTYDVVAKTLEMGDQYGLDIYIGLQVNDEWFTHYTNNQGWLNNESLIAGQLIEDLWSKYGHHPSFKGWYLSFEVDNWHLPTAVEWQRMADFYNSLIAVTNTVSPNLPIMISPFYNVSGGLTPSAWETMWSYILSRTDIDIFALQDGVGAGHASTSDLAAWFAATRNAIMASSPATALWADTETFNKNYKPMNLRHMLDNMLAVQPYVSEYTSFSFNHYLSPQTVNPLYYATYASYLATAAMDALAPVASAELAATATEPNTANLSWSAWSDNKGVVGYRIYRDGAEIATVNADTYGYKDKELLPNTAYLYSVRAFDAAGNLSLSNEAAVTTLEVVPYPNVQSSGKPYTASLTAHSSYSDTGGMELTDGLKGSTDYGNAAWQGRNTADPYHFVLDLGQTRTIGELSANFLQVQPVFIFLPKEVRFWVSSDNVNFDHAGTADKPVGIGAGSQDLTGLYRVSGLSGMSGRYVKVEVVPANGAWTFMDELEVRN
ncbi:DUF4434 domain-containing protein [Paenibacillus sp. M.A.Huq-81]